jgi:AcrR family transcriptional regulator
MRVKTDCRRQAILDAALALFREVGFMRTSMARISACAGGSKATLYSYFSSKEELFAAAMVEAMGEQGQAMIDLLDPSEPDVPKVLYRFGEAYLDFVTDPEHMACARTAIAEGRNSDLGAALYRLGPKRGWSDITAYIDTVMDLGALRKADPHLAAMHLKGMLEAGMVYPMLFGAEPELDKATAVKGAVEAFLRAYGKPTPPAGATDA